MTKNKMFRFSAKTTNGPVIGVAVIDDCSVDCYFKFYDHFSPTSVEVLQSPDYKLSFRTLDEAILSCFRSGFAYLKFHE